MLIYPVDAPGRAVQVALPEEPQRTAWALQGVELCTTILVNGVHLMGPDSSAPRMAATVAGQAVNLSMASRTSSARPRVLVELITESPPLSPSDQVAQVSEVPAHGRLDEVGDAGVAVLSAGDYLLYFFGKILRQVDRVVLILLVVGHSV